MNPSHSNSNDEEKLSKIVDAISALAALDFTYEIKYDDSDNDLFSVIAGGINMLSEELQVRVVEKELLLASEARYKKLASIVESSQDAIVTSNIETGKIVSWNKGAENIYGYPAEEAINKTVNILIPERKRGEIKEVFLDIKAGNNPQPITTKRIKKNGEEFDASISFATILNEHGKTTHVATLCRDVSEQIKAEKEVMQKAKELEKINLELDRFAHIVSHDLKAPLRTISTLTKFLEDELKDTLTPKAKEQFDLVRQRTESMSNMISGILEYSKVGRIKSKFEKVDLKDIMRDLQTLVINENAELKIQMDFPVIFASKTMILQVFQNLISNAVKYNDKPICEIELNWWKQEDGFYRFSVSDNGPGIDEKYHERIFDIFQTIESRKKSESTGVGLSIVKKIIEEGGGKIWVEKPSPGITRTTISFTWPSKIPS